MSAHIKRLSVTYRGGITIRVMQNVPFSQQKLRQKVCGIQRKTIRSQFKSVMLTLLVLWPNSHPILLKCTPESFAPVPIVLPKRRHRNSCNTLWVAFGIWIVIVAKWLNKSVSVEDQGLGEWEQVCNPPGNYWLCLWGAQHKGWKAVLQAYSSRCVTVLFCFLFLKEASAWYCHNST